MFQNTSQQAFNFRFIFFLSIGFINQARKLRDGKRVNLLRISVANLECRRMRYVNMDAVVINNRSIRVVINFDLIDAVNSNAALSPNDLDLTVNSTPIRSPLNQIKFFKLLACAGT